MEIKEIGKWKGIENTEIFYDKVFKHVIVRNGLQIDLKPLTISTSISLTIDKNAQSICQQNFSQLRVNMKRNLISALAESGEYVMIK